MKPSERFISWLEERIRRGRPGERLPTDDRIAAQFGISKSTVRRLARPYRAAGTLTRIQGKGTFLGSRPEQEEAPSFRPPKSSVRDVADRVLEAIHAGLLRRGQVLPAVKQMVYQLRVSPGTVRKAYRLLEDKGMVARAGRTYRVGTFGDMLRPGTLREIVLIREGTKDFARLFTRDELAQAYRKMERELLANGFVLHFRTRPELEPEVKLWRRLKRLPHGLALRVNDEADFPECRRLWDDAKRCAGALGRPAPNLLMDCNRIPLSGWPRGAHLISRGNIITTNARALAHYLVQRRYRQTVFFPEPGAGSPGSWLAKHRSELKHLDRDFVFRAAAVPRAGRRQSLSRLGKELAATISVPRTGQHLSKYRKVPAQVLLDESTVLPGYEAVHARFPNARIWVFARDERAAEALHWAQRKGLEVPSTLSILSSEHAPEFYHLGLTCCFPDHEQIGYQMAHALIGDFPVARTSKGFIRTRALLVDKLTTRREEP